jgi:uncharacterized protein YjbI with pentapeptide repeats
MEAMRSWLQTVRKLLVTVGIIVACLLGIALIVGIIGGYLFHWGWTGITNKTLWDWLNLLGVLAIPVVVGFGAVWFTVRHNHDIELARAQHENDQRITLDNQRETVLQTYLDKISDLILHENLQNAGHGDKVRYIARARTLTALSNLDPNRKRSIILFLYESVLIERDDEKIDLGWADLREVNLSQLILTDISFEGAYLQGSNLSGADLSQSNLEGAEFQGANLSGANLSGARLSRTDLRETDLRGANLLEESYSDDANLEDADLRGANLKGAQVTTEQLKQATSLKGATMPDGSIHP